MKKKMPKVNKSADDMSTMVNGYHADKGASEVKKNSLKSSPFENFVTRGKSKGYKLT